VRSTQNARRGLLILRGTNSSSSALTSPNAADVAALVVDVMPLVMRAIRREMRAAAADSVSVPQLRALLFVRQNPETNLSALAEHLGIGLTGASGLVDRLVRQQLLTRVTDPAERRRIQLTVTAQGKARLDEAIGSTRDAVETALAGLAPHDAIAIEQAMIVLRDAFQHEAEQ
jgi:DNA-binding MarR family transcriptional regulator